MVQAQSSGSNPPLKKQNLTPGTDFRLKSLSTIFFMHPVLPFKQTLDFKTGCDISVIDFVEYLLNTILFYI